ncbi:gliding motility-associated C-terminal domain-containing protein [Fluviicola taffensis]|uniref:UDP-N-acetylglucosamine enolpyruvyl transferase n=1 Tax=Fluviicola taffensis (strain DSM 16823 / NCIMB 13979 / RW262) TaxID=755732 RepID=F2IE82_FLUTR|nr:gliding motility-associated C-terminal domain-containing protein [Fluviicola taffensis]AEA42400.1 UDP-N-acetylglucosamine enolpyruvyl transferase [Fluviicola taffensis DSM 16823]
MKLPLLFFLFLLSESIFGQLTVSSVTSTVSTCPNNGGITITASTTNPPLTYSIVSGPVIQPIQTNSSFTSLPPGNYTVDVADAAGNHSPQSITVTGTYSMIDFVPSKVAPYCPGDNTGSLVGNLVPSTGLAPFTWQLIPASGVPTPTQTSSSFQNLSAGNYTIKATDGCNNLRTIAVTIQDAQTDMMFGSDLSSEKIGCDTMRISFYLMMDKLRYPLNYQYSTSNGNFNLTTETIIDSSHLDTHGYIQIVQDISGLTYGDYIQVAVTNACGDQIVSPVQNTYPFIFYPKYSFNQCGNSVNAVFENTPSVLPYHTFLKQPLTYTLTDLATGLVTASGTASGGMPIAGVAMPNPLVPGESYHLLITDGCGQTFEQDYLIPGEAPPVIINGEVVYDACIDSVVGTYRIHTSGFSTNSRLVLLSGPATLGSTNPEFAYSDTYSYPDTVPGADYFFLSNLAIGTYTYKVIDDCGNELPGTFIIHPQDVTSLGYDHSYRRGCPGENKIYFTMHGGGYVIIRDIVNDTILDEVPFSYYGAFNNDSLLNLPSGPYEITFEFEGTPQYEINDTPMPCALIIDTITIEPYEFPDVLTNNTILCNNSLHLELIPDTSKGVAPYQYEIIAGPELFPLQSSNTFLVSIPGVYTVRIFDACGNAASKQVTVDSITFIDPQAIVDCNNTQIIFPSSVHTTYEWITPSNQVFIGDSLILSPLTPADTGIYQISKIVNINGCVDTFFMDYHVVMNGLINHDYFVCTGDSILISGVYYLPGIYSEVLQSVNGCDSIIQISVLILESQIDTNHVVICLGDSLEITPSIFVNTSGVYIDSLQNVAGCYDFTITNLFVSGASSLVDSIICSGDSVQLGNQYYQTTGIYTDTLVSFSGCDSIATLDLTVLPPKFSTIIHDMCVGESFIHNNILYTQAGTYTQVFPTSTCDSIVTIQISLYPPISINATASNVLDVQYGNVIHLNAQTTGGTAPFSYFWSSEGSLDDNSIHNPMTTVVSSNWFAVTVIDSNGCIAIDSIFIGLSETSTLYVPNSFTPGTGDGFNDVFRVKYTNISEFHILIFDRWGEVIYESTDVNFGWDATYRKKVVQDGIYVYKISALGKDFVKYDLTGHITVLK